MKLVISVLVASFLFVAFYLHLGTNLSSDKLFQLVNEWRIENGYQPYVESKLACKIATTRLPEIQADFSHKAFYNRNFCRGCWISENIIRHYGSEEETLNAWLQSSDHRAALTKDNKYSCVKCSGTYCQQTFTNL